MERPTNILVPIDFGPTSEGVLSYASLLADGFKAKLHVFHALHSPETQGWSAEVASTPRLSDQVEKEVRERLAVLIQNEVKAPDVETEIGVSSGVPFAEILAYAESHGVNLIVMGSHGMTSLVEKIMVGSVAEKVVRRAHCPVVVVRRPPE